MENNKLFEKVKIIIVLIVSLILMAVLVSFVIYLLSQTPPKSKDLINNNELESYLIEKTITILLIKKITIVQLSQLPNRVIFIP